jgi:hypothetical protein
VGSVSLFSPYGAEEGVEATRLSAEHKPRVEVALE